MHKFKISEKSIDFDYVLDPLVRTKTLIEFFKTKEIKPKSQIDDTDETMFYIIHPVLKHLSIIDYNNE